MKKAIALLLVAMMALSMTAACAGSPTNYEPTVKTGTTTGRQGTEVSTGDMIVKLLNTNVIDNIINKIKAWVAAGNSPISYFPEEIQTGVAAALVEGQNADDLEMNEIEGLMLKNADKVIAQADVVKMLVTFTTKFEVGQKVFALIGFIVDAEQELVEWVALEGEPQDDGSVLLYVPVDLVARMQTEDFVVLAMLNTPKAE